MRTLLLSPVFPPARGGIETVAGQLADRLRDEVLVVTLAPGGVADARDLRAKRRGRTKHVAASERGVPSVLRVRNVPRGGRRSILRVNARALAAGIRYRPDVILVLHVKLAPAALILGRLIGVPFVQYVHAKEMREVPDVARLAVEAAETIIAVSSYSAELAGEAGASPERIRIIHNGIDLPPEARAERDRTPTLITVSRLEDRYKGHDVLLQGLPAIRREVPDLRWIVVGDGTLRPELEERAKELGVADCVSFMGTVDNAERDQLLDRAWAFVMLSRRPPGRQAGEGFGIALVEAGAHGLPTIAGRVPGVVDAVRHEVTGLLVDPTNVSEIVATTTKLLADEGLARRLGAGGRERAQELQWPAVAGQVQEALEQSVGRHSRPRPRPKVGWRWVRELLLGSSNAL